MSEVKFSIFTDLHYLPNIFYTEAEERLSVIAERAKCENVDFMIHLGDLTHQPSTDKKIVEQYDAIPLTTYHCIGNHECQGDTYEAVLKAYNLDCGYYYFDKNGFRFIVLDLNYMREDGKAVHYNLGNYFSRKAGTQLVTFEEGELEWFKKTVKESPYPCILFSHHSLEHLNNGMSFDELKSLWQVLDELNGDKQRIIMAINGHHHKDNLRIFKNIVFLDLNSASYEWIDDGHTDKYPQELYEKYRLVGNTLVYTNPLSAIITLRDDGYIKIDGASGEFLYGVDRQSLNMPLCEADGRLSTANVVSAEFTLNF